MGTLYSLELIYRKYDYNSNKFYELEEIKSEHKYKVYLSPFGKSCFNISTPKYPNVGDTVFVSWEDGIFTLVNGLQLEFDIFFLIRLLLGSCILMFSSSLSQSKSFYYISAATLSAVLGLLIIIYYVMRQYACMPFLHSQNASQELYNKYYCYPLLSWSEYIIPSNRFFCHLETVYS